MSVSTALTLSPVSSRETLRKPQFYQSSNDNYNNNNNNNNNNIAYHDYSNKSLGDLKQYMINEATLSSDENLLLERTRQNSAGPSNISLIHKSNSYSGSIQPKATLLKQDSANGRIATSLTDSESDYSGIIIPITCSSAVPAEAYANDAIDEHDTFLISSATCSADNSSISSNNRRLKRAQSKTRCAICKRAQPFVRRNWYLSYLVPLSILIALMFVAYLTRDYAQRLLYWIETQDPWVIFFIFMLLFIIVSFPVVVGYFVLMVTAGYLFGCFKGFLTVILGANVGIAIAHLTLRSLRHHLPIQKLIKNETGRAILRVISGTRAFRVVLFTRLTPIPFGIQNAIFGVSAIKPRIYHTASLLGLLPAQMINVYLGSTLRSMHEVLNNHGTALTGYISFGVEVVCGVALMLWIVHKARKELSETLLTDISTEGKLVDIQV